MKNMGISFAAQEWRCGILVKEVRFATRDAGAEVQFVHEEKQGKDKKRRQATCEEAVCRRFFLSGENYALSSRR
jgi:hypothetical protein